MRLAKGIAAAACLLAGLWVTLRATGALPAIFRAVPHWWPAAPAAIGAAILIRSTRPGPHRGVAIGLIGASCLALAIVHHLIPVIAWQFAASAVLIVAGMRLAYLSARSSPSPGDDKTQRIVMVFRSGQRPCASSNLARIRVYLFCGHLDLDIRGCVSPGPLKNEPLMIEVVACLASVTLVTQDVPIHHHEAFDARIGKPMRGLALRDEDTDQVAVVVATLAILGGFDIRIQNPAPAAPGS